MIIPISLIKKWVMVVKYVYWGEEKGPDGVDWKPHSFPIIYVKYSLIRDLQDYFKTLLNSVEAMVTHF